MCAAPQQSTSLANPVPWCPTGLATALCMWLDSSDRIFDQYLVSVMAVEGRVRDDDRTEQGELKRKAKF